MQIKGKFKVQVTLPGFEDESISDTSLAEVMPVAILRLDVLLNVAVATWSDSLSAKTRVLAFVCNKSSFI